MAKPRRRPNRRTLLLAAIRAQGGEWTTARAAAFYARTRGVQYVYTSNARRDLRRLAADGHLTTHANAVGHRYYTARTGGPR
jgi:hypothetical protein